MQYKECLTFTKKTSCISANVDVYMACVSNNAYCTIACRYYGWKTNDIPLARTSRKDLEGYPKLIGE